MDEALWPDVRLHVVTGKGGTGKTTVAAAMALALARGGHRTLLIEVEGRQGIAGLFDVGPLPYEERRIAAAPGGGEVWALAVDVEAALVEYLEMFYNLKRAGGMLRRMGAVDFATTIAPGIRDVLLTGKVKEAVTRVVRGRPAYDAVILDAPPSGRITRFLTVTAEVAGLTRMGPINKHSQGVISLIRSPACVVHAVSLLEEMPVQETAECVAELAAAGLPVGAILVNRTRTSLLPRTKLAEEVVQAAVAQARMEPTDELVAALAAEATDHRNRATVERRQRLVLGQLERPVLDVPLLTDGVDLGGLQRLAGSLAGQGLVLS